MGRVKVVIDEGVPRQLVQALRERGLEADRFNKNWRETSNGALIALVESAGYDVLLTNDKNIADQQSLKGRSIAVVALPLNRRSAVMGRIDDIADTVSQAKPGQHIVMGLDGRRTAKRIVAGETVAEDLPDVSPFGM